MKYIASKVFSYKQLATVAAVLGLLALGAFFMANVTLPAEAHFVSALNVILFAVPVFWSTMRWLGRRDAIILFAVFGVLALAIETLAIVTGFPYGHFGYSDLLGYRLFGYTPWTVALAWTPLVFAAYAISARSIVGEGPAIWTRTIRVFVLAVLLVMFDVVLDPGAVRIGFWRYEGGGEFYGVPLSNFVGWLFSGTIAGIVIEIFLWIKKPLLPTPVQLASSTFFIIAFWTLVAFFTGTYLPMAIGLLLSFLLVAFWVNYHYSFDDMIVYLDEDGTAIGTAQKLAAHDADTKLHSAFSVFLFNKKGELLLQQRALSKKTWPGVWSNSCCGHVMLHEPVEKAARRRIAHELGIAAGELHLILPDFRYRAEKDGVVENEICPVFVGFAEATPQPNAEEVADIRWVDWEEFVVEVADPANGYSPWAREEVELLAASENFGKTIRAVYSK